MSFQNANILIQQFINNYGNTTRTYEALNYVRNVSTANNQVTLDPNTFLKGPGKLRQVRINYFPILCDTEGSCSANLCDDGEVVEPAQRMFEITRCTASKKYKIEKDSIRLLDNGQWDFTNTALQIMASAMPGMRRALATDWVTYLYDLAGVHPDGNATHRISVTNPASGIVNAIGKYDIEREYQDAGLMPPYILGGQEVYNWKKMVGIGGLNASGQLINQVDTSNSYYDDSLSDTILGNASTGGNILAIAPETFKYVYYLENAGIFRTDMASINDLGMLYSRGTHGFIEGTLIDPVTGIPWDLYINYDKCNQYWTFQIKHRWDFFVMPDTACLGQGVNGIMHYRTCPQVIATCPSGDTPSPAITPVTFSWTPGSIFPVFIANSNIGGVQNQPQTNVTNIAGLVALMNDNYGTEIFSVNGSDIEYDGFSAISVNFNSGDITGTFAI